LSVPVANIKYAVSSHCAVFVIRFGEGTTCLSET
jgi:hypothetical protein